MGIPEAEKRARSYPHEFPAAMRQRVMIAMALITRPEILIADEPTTALDVTVPEQILDLIKDRQKELGTGVIFITHDLAVISEVCDEINVMYAGRLMERAASADLFKDPRHAYTRSLLKSIPATHEKAKSSTRSPVSLPTSAGQSPAAPSLHATTSATVANASPTSDRS